MLRAALFALPLSLGMIASPIIAPAVQAQTTPVDAPLAERAPEVHEMLQALGMYEVLDIMASEAMVSATQLETDLFPGQGGPAWDALATRLNAADRMAAAFEAAFPLDRISPEEVAQVTAFATAEPGRSIVEAELAARRAFLTPAIEDEAQIRFRERAAAGDPRIDLLTRFIAANDLVERNVSGALNSNYAFFRGLTDGGAFEVEMPEDLMLAEVWGQEPEIRADTIEWLYSFQLAAYDRLTDADLEAYIAMSETPAGQAMNAVLFQAFDTMFETMSYDLGQAAAIFIAGEDT
jgi:hypothetical protein